MKIEISKLLAGLLICAGLMACSPEKPESEKAAEGKTGSTNELVIANTDANALPSQEEDFSEETKAKLKKLREEAAILKAEAELNITKKNSNLAVLEAYDKPSYSNYRDDETIYDKEDTFSLTKQDLLNRIDAISGFEDPKIKEGLSNIFDKSSGSNGILDNNEAELFRYAAIDFLKESGTKASKANNGVDALLYDIN